MVLVLSNKGKGMQSSSEQPLVGEEHCVTTLITAAKETMIAGNQIRIVYFPRDMLSEIYVRTGGD